MREEQERIENLYRKAITVSVQEYGLHIRKKHRDNPLELYGLLCDFLIQTTFPFKKGVVIKVRESSTLEDFMRLICIVGDRTHGNCVLIDDRKLSSTEKELYVHKPNIIREVRSLLVHSSSRPVMRQVAVIAREKYRHQIERMKLGEVIEDEAIHFIDILHEHILMTPTNQYDRMY